MEWFIPFQVNSFHPASPDGAPGNAAAPSAGSVFTTASPAAQKESGRPGSVARSTPRRSAPRRAATFHRFIKHVLHVESASGDFQAKRPKHPISDDTLPHKATHMTILLVCVICVLHTTGDSSPGGTGSRRMSFRSRPKARSDTSHRGSGGLPRSRQEGRDGRGRLDAFEPPLLRADGHPLTRPVLLPWPWTCAGAGAGARRVCLSRRCKFLCHLVVAVIRR